MPTTLRRLADSLASTGRFDESKARTLEQYALKNNILSAQEKTDFRAILRDYADLFEPSAAAVLQKLLASTPLPPATRLWPLVKTGQRPVYLTQDGAFTVRTDGSVPVNPIDVGDALFRAAQVVDDGTGNLFREIAAPPELLKKSFETLEKNLAAAQTLPATQGAAFRASAATVLLHLIEAAAGHSVQAPMLAAYDKVVRGETSQMARETMIFHLANSTVAKSGEAKRLADGLMLQLAPLTPQYDKYFANGNNTFNVFMTVGQGQFWGGFTTQLKKAGFVATGSENQFGESIYEKTITQNGRATKFRVTIAEGGRDILNRINRPEYQMLAYDGHSDWGRNMSSSLTRAPDALNGGDGKLVFYNLCVGKGVLDRFRARFPNTQIVTTYGASNFYTDANDKMTTGEGIQCLLAMFNGIAARADWQTIHRDMNRAANIGWGRTWDNVLTPVSTLVREKVLDRDNDGQADALDKLFDYNLFRVAEDTARDFTPIQPSRVAGKLDGTKVLIAGQMINTLSEFSSVLDRVNRDSKVTTDGYFEATHEDDTIRFTPATAVDGRAEFRMQVANTFAHTSEESLRVMAVYEFNRFLSDTRRLTLDPVDAKINGLLLAAHSLDVDEGHRDTTVWQQFLAKYHLPKVELPVIRALLDEEHRHYAGSPELIRALRAKLSPEVLAELKRPEVGRPGTTIV